MSLRSAERPGHRNTTRHAQAIYPFITSGGLGGRGVFVLGKLGQGKSALVKTLLWRMLLFGRRALVLDIKRDYGGLCRAVGVRPLRLHKAA